MDIVEWLRQFKLSTSDSNYNALIVNGKIEEAADEIERLRSQMDLFDPNTTQEMAAAALNFANDEIKRLQKNAKRDAKYMLAIWRMRQMKGKEFMEAFDQAVKLYEDEQPAKATGDEWCLN